MREIPPGLLAVAGTVGQAVLGLLATLLMGRTMKDLLVRPLAWIARKTETREDDKIVSDVRADWGLEPDPTLTGEPSDKKEGGVPVSEATSGSELETSPVTK